MGSVSARSIFMTRSGVGFLVTVNAPVSGCVSTETKRCAVAPRTRKGGNELLDVTKDESKRKRPLRRLLALFLLAAMVCIGCSSGWNDSEQDQVRDLCRNRDGSSSQCECVVAAVENAYPDPGDFSRSTSPSAELETGLNRCSAGL
ncbi:MAG: hypothetical protein ACI8Y4_005458 [Candidatus Poriferisodalaceae bacterium]|jgi:hypothetical protein